MQRFVKAAALKPALIAAVALAAEAASPATARHPDTHSRLLQLPNSAFEGRAD